MTISQVQGCGKQHGWKEYYRGTEVMLNMIPKVKFELVVDDGEVGPLVDLIRATARTGEVGDGKIFVFPVEDVVRIRTGETGEDAVGAACWPPVASRRLRAGIPFTAVVFVIPRSRTGRFWRAHRKRRAIGRIGPVCGRSRERGGRS